MIENVLCQKSRHGESDARVDDSDSVFPATGWLPNVMAYFVRAVVEQRNSHLMAVAERTPSYSLCVFLAFILTKLLVKITNTKACYQKLARLEKTIYAIIHAERIPSG